MTEGSEDGSWSESEKTEAIIIKPLKSLSVSSNDVRNKLEKTEHELFRADDFCSQDAELIEPKKLHNPVLTSRPHLRLHKELKLTHARYVAEFKRSALTQNKLKLHTDNSSGSSKYVCDGEHRLVPHMWHFSKTYSTQK